MAAASMLTLVTEDGEEITVHVIKFESVYAFELMMTMDSAEPSAAQLSALRKKVLACSYVTRNDARGERVKIEFAGKQGAQLDQAMNKAFQGTGAGGLIKAIKFAWQVNYQSFLDEQRVEQQAKLDAPKPSPEVTDPDPSNSD